MQLPNQKRGEKGHLARGPRFQESSVGSTHPNSGAPAVRRSRLSEKETGEAFVGLRSRHWALGDVESVMFWALRGVVPHLLRSRSPNL